MPINTLIASLVALLAVAIAGISQGAFGIEAAEVARLLDAAYFNAWPCTWYAS